MEDQGQAFYAAFEDRFRGSFDLIYSRLQQYLPDIREIFRDNAEDAALDLGCGRGEWLQLLRSANIRGFGVDSNAAMLDVAQDRGLHVVVADILEFLRSQPNQSYRLITAFHVVEHLPWQLQLELFQEAFRCLQDGGVLLLEWPNTSQLLVLSKGFWLDPTHLRPVPAELLAFMAEYSGFSRIKSQAVNGDMDLNIFCERGSLKKGGQGVIADPETGSATLQVVAGVNIIGYVSANLGLGVFARFVTRFFASLGYAVAILDMDAGLGRSGSHQDYAGTLVATPENLPYDINIFVLPPAEIESIRQNSKGFQAGWMANKFNAALLFWELQVIPPTWCAALQDMDAILAPTGFIYHTVASSCPGPLIIDTPLAISLPTFAVRERRDFNLPEEGVLFVASFEPYSDPVRKNIAATIAAFQQGVGNHEDAWLIIKTNNADTEYARNIIKGIEVLANSHPRIRFLHQTLTYEDVLAFYQLCDVYVSLHRAEGFGLGLFEAMALGLPVIATSWSGNMSFMDAECACLVRYQLVPVQNAMIAAYDAVVVGPEARWAEPDVQQAAGWMAALAGDAQLRKKIGEAARRRIKRWNEDAYRSRFWEIVQAAKTQKRLLRGQVENRSLPALPPQPWLPQWRWSPTERQWAEEEMAGWEIIPHLSILLVENYDPHYVEASRASLDAQWVAVACNGVAGGEAAIATIQSALRTGGGDWLALMDAGDQLAPDASFRIAQAIRKHPQWQLIYTDEDNLTPDGQHINPHCKPDFNLDYLRSLPYTGGLLLIRKDLFAALGGFDPEAEGAEDYDLVLRAWEHLQAAGVGDAGIGHIPEVLYHRLQGSSHCRKSIPEILAAGQSALERHLQRLEIAAEVHPGPFPPSFRVRYALSATPLVSIIIPTRDQLGFLQRCIESVIEKTRYPAYEILVVDNDSQDPEAQRYLDLLAEQEESLGGRLRVLRYPGAFNFSAMNNQAVGAARGEYVLLLNNDTAALHEDWLDEMMSHALRPGVGIVGAKLFYPDGKIQHAGVILGMKGPAEHPFIGRPPEDRGYFGRAQLTQDYSAVTAACLLVRKEIFQTVGGLDEERFQVSYNDVDLCLKVREGGHRIVWTPWAMLLHEGSASQKGEVEQRPSAQKLARFAAEKTAFYDRWLPQLAFDPAYNRHLSLVSTDFLLEDQPPLSWDPAWRPRPRVLVHSADREGCGEYRIIAPMRALRTAGRVQGWETMRIFEPAEMERFSPDSIVLQRQMEWPQIEALERHRRFSKAFRVFEIDDLITNLPTKSVHKASIHKDIAKRFRKAAGLCNRLVVATEPLAKAYAHFSDEVRVVPNYLERARWDGLTPRRRGGAKPRVGWAGGVGHTGDLELVADVVRELAKEVDWVFFGLCPDALRPYVQEFYPGVPLPQYPAKLASLDLDLAIAPLEDNPFNEAKSHLRLLEYGVLGYPVVCSDLTPYQGDFPVWRVANRYRDWLKTIREAVSDRAALARQGDLLREKVRQQWLLEDHLDVWLQAWLPRG